MKKFKIIKNRQKSKKYNKIMKNSVSIILHMKNTVYFKNIMNNNDEKLLIKKK